MWITLAILTYILFWLVCIASYTVYYLTEVIQVTSFSQVLYTLNAGADGAQGTIGQAVSGFFEKYWLLLLLGTVLFGICVYLCVKRWKLKKKGVDLFVRKQWNRAFNFATLGSCVLCAALLVANVANGLDSVGYAEYQANVNRVSGLYEDHFVQPDDVKLTFPEEKRNLIHIVLESMESSYTDREHGGGYQEDLIPNLYDMAKNEGTDFSMDDEAALNGAYVTNNSGWTVAGLVAQSAAVPLNVGNGAFIHNLDEDIAFMPNVTALGDLLEDKGYKNVFMCGSDGSYAGRSNYYRQHGDYEIMDYAAASGQGAIPKGYRVWWGFEDQKLFPWAQDELTRLAQGDQPFNFTMLTSDTHFTDGYLCEKCEDEFDSQYKNVIACSDRQLREFLDWIKEQDFYENTTIVLSGDHLSMDGSVGANCPSGYQRKAFCAVINGPDYAQNRTREYCTLDIYPTIVEAMGIQIEGGRLGLGTSLYSSQDTLIEEMGLLALNAELSANSDYYTNVIMSGDETDPNKKAEEKPAQDMIEQPDGKTYEENPDSFDDPNYTWQAPVYQPPVYYPPVTPSDPTPQPPADPGTGDSGTDTPDNPGNPGDGSSVNPPVTPEPTPPSDGNSTAPTPPSGGDSTTPTPPSGGDSTVTPPSGGSTTPVEPPADVTPPADTTPPADATPGDTAPAAIPDPAPSVETPASEAA